jgi:hypothetical protein
MLSHYINDRYYGGDDEYTDEYEGGIENKTVILFVVGVMAGLMAMVVFLYVSRNMSGCLSSFISHLRPDFLQDNQLREAHMSQHVSVQRRNTYL